MAATCNQRRYWERFCVQLLERNWQLTLDGGQRKYSKMVHFWEFIYPLILSIRLKEVLSQTLQGCKASCAGGADEVERPLENRAKSKWFPLNFNERENKFIDQI